MLFYQMCSIVCTTFHTFNRLNFFNQYWTGRHNSHEEGITSAILDPGQHSQTFVTNYSTQVSCDLSLLLSRCFERLFFYVDSQKRAINLLSLIPLLWLFPILERWPVNSPRTVPPGQFPPDNIPMRSVPFRTIHF